MKAIINKTLFFCLVLVLTGIGLAGCKKSFLERMPYDQVTNETFWASESDALLALTGVYSHSGTGTEDDFLNYITVFFDDQKSDNAFELPGGIREMYVDGTNNATHSIITNTWKSAYTRIGKVNFFLENVERVPMDETKKNIMKAEARFIRAVYYFYMSQYWGGVPLVTKVLTIDEANSVTRNSKAEIVKFVIDELTECAEILPATRPASENGRITKGAALAFLGRLLMSDQKWDEAAAVYKSIIDLDVYSISPDYSKLFIDGNQDNPEIVYALRYTQGTGGRFSNQVPYRWAPRILTGVTQLGPTNDLVEAYEMTDGKAITESPLYDPANPFANRDPRLYYTVLLPNYSIVNGKRYVTHPDSVNAPDRMPTYSKTGYGYMKYIDPNYTGDIRTYGSSIPLVRYSEILLSYLESKLEAGDAITQQLLDETINKVRGRASVNMPPVTQTDPAALRPILRNERRVELALEGIRHWDILRWHIAHIVLNGNVYGAKVCDLPGACGFQTDAEGHYFLYKRNFRENVDYLWPIPQSERDINPNLEQNPGY